MDAAKKNLRMYSKDGLAPYGEDLDKYLYNMNILYYTFETEEQRLRARKEWADSVLKDPSELAKNIRGIHNMIKTHENHLSAKYPITEEQKDRIEFNPVMDPRFLAEQNARQNEVAEQASPFVPKQKKSE